MSLLQLYKDQAAKQLIDGDQAALRNVRERCERAAAAWSALAAREKRSDDARAKRREAISAHLTPSADAEGAD